MRASMSFKNNIWYLELAYDKVAEDIYTANFLAVLQNLCRGAAETHGVKNWDSK